MLDANFWQDKALAQKIIKEKKFQEELINSYKKSVKEAQDLSDLYELALEENNQSVAIELLKNLENTKSRAKKNEIKCFLSNESDSSDCYLEIHAGAGGTESQDWAQMLRRMYLKWSSNNNFKHSLSFIKKSQSVI